MGYEKRRQVCLVTTAIEASWDFAKPIVFLGEWCRLYDRKKIWQPLQAPVIPFPWNDTQRLTKAIIYTEKVYADILMILVPWLNRIHRLKRSIRYWKIIFGWGLLSFIQTIYDKYVCLQEAVAHYPNLSIVDLSPFQYDPPHLFKDLMELCQYSDYYNLHLYTQIAHYLSVEAYLPKIQYAECSPPKVRGSKPKKEVSCGERLFRNILDFLGFFAPIRLFQVHFSNRDLIKLILSSRLKAWPLFKYEIPPVRSRKRDDKKRESLGGTSEKISDPFERLIIGLLKLHLPTGYIEDFSAIRRLTCGHMPKAPAAVLTAMGWHSSLSFAIWLAECAEKSTIAVAVQEGGNYGLQQLSSLENTCLDITDGYISYGWNRQSKNVYPLPSPKFFYYKQKKLRDDSEHADILWVSTVFSRYVFFFATSQMSSQYIDYLKHSERFYQALDLNIKKVVSRRIDDRYSFGWFQKKRILDACPGLKITGTNTPLMKAILGARLVVIDYLGSTAFLEAIASGQPTIMFNSDRYFKLQKNALPFYEGLKSVGVYHDNAESAAKIINVNHSNIETWWNEKQRKTVVSQFVYQFARTSEHSFYEWRKYLKSLMEKR